MNKLSSRLKYVSTEQIILLESSGNDSSRIWASNLINNIIWVEYNKKAIKYSRKFLEFENWINKFWLPIRYFFKIR